MPIYKVQLTSVGVLKEMATVDIEATDQFDAARKADELPSEDLSWDTEDWEHERTEVRVLDPEDPERVILTMGAEDEANGDD
jgi:hypothetical protein